jgi:CheY-like chemotaxis protein
MVKLEEDFDDLDEFDDFKEEKIPIQNDYDYKSRRILVWVNDGERLSMVEETLNALLTLATIRVVGNEEKAVEFLEKEEWDTFVVDLTEEGVSESEFVKMANNDPNILLVALNYFHLNREDEQYPVYSEPIRKLFDLEEMSSNLIEEQE